MKIIKYALLVILTIALNSYLEALHQNFYDLRFESCEKIVRSKYPETWTREMQFRCVEDFLEMKILGTLLFREGSILKGMEE